MNSSLKIAFLIIAGLAILFGSALMLRYLSLASAIAGSSTVFINIFLLQRSIESLSCCANTKKNFWKTLPFRLAVMVVLFYVFLVAMRLPFLSFLAGMIIMFVGYSIWLIRFYRQQTKNEKNR